MSISELVSSEAEVPSAQRPAAAVVSSKGRLPRDLRSIHHLFTEDSNDDEDEDEEGLVGGYLPPGRATTSSKPKRLEKEGKKSSPDLQKLVLQSLAYGGDSKDVLTLAVLSQLLAKKKRKKGKASSSHDPLGGSSSDD